MYGQQQQMYGQQAMMQQQGMYGQQGMMQPGMMQPGMMQQQPMGMGMGMPQQPAVNTAMWMQRPQPIPGVPAGLEYLAQIDQVFVQQVPSLLEAFTGWETNNKYVIRNSAGQQCYYAFEDSDACERQCCGPQRSFTIFIVDNNNQQVAKIWRPFKCCGGHHLFAYCCDCCAHEVLVESPVGQVIGSVKELGSNWSPKYAIRDENGKEVLGIEGPCCVLTGPFCPADNKFRVMSLDGSREVGAVTEKYSGFVQEMYTTAQNFSISFPMDLNVKTKATMFAALFLIDFMFFEKPPENNDQTY